MTPRDDFAEKLWLLADGLLVAWRRELDAAMSASRAVDPTILAMVGAAYRAGLIVPKTGLEEQSIIGGLIDAAELIRVELTTDRETIDWVLRSEFGA